MNPTTLQKTVLEARGTWVLWRVRSAQAKVLCRHSTLPPVGAEESADQNSLFEGILNRPQFVCRYSRCHNLARRDGVLRYFTLPRAQIKSKATVGPMYWTTVRSTWEVVNWRGVSRNCHHSCTVSQGVPVAFGHQALFLRGYSVIPKLNFPPSSKPIGLAVTTRQEKARFGIPPASLM